LVISVHPRGCNVLQAYAARVLMLGLSDSAGLSSGAAGVPGGLARLPDSPAELMLRVVSMMVDDYLDLRKVMTRQLDRWQQRLLRPDKRFDDWETLLQSRQALHHLYDICEDQRGAMSRWMDILE